VLDFRLADGYQEAGGAVVELLTPIMIAEPRGELGHGLVDTLRADLARVLNALGVVAGDIAGALVRIGNATYSAGIMLRLVVASRVGQENISCQFEREYMVHAPPRPCDVGGMSRAFLAAVIHRGNVSLWQPAGVIYECHNNFEIILASRLDRLGPNGHIAG
jgi:hypothetical protein